MIDSQSTERGDVSLSVRSEILSYAFRQKPVIPQLEVAKPHSLIQRDKATYDKLVQEATEQSRQTYSNNPALQAELDAMDSTISALRADKQLLVSKRSELDTEELVNHVEWSTKKDRKEHAVSDKFNLSTHPYKIRNVIKGGSREHWKREERTEFTLSGKVEGERFHKLKAYIILQIFKRDKFEKEIIGYTKKIEEKESGLEDKTVARAKLMKAHESIFKEKSEKLIEEARQKFKAYLEDCMTPDEAIERLDEINNDH